MTKNTPSIELTYPSRTEMYNNRETPMVVGQSIFKLAEETFTGWIKAVMPSTRARLQMFDPITFPMAMSGLPLMADCKLINNSGAEVPKATMVRPTTRGERCNLRAMLDAPFTR